MRLNNLTGKAWAKLSKSTWITQSLLAWSERVPLQIDSTFIIKKQHKKIGGTMHYRALDETRVKIIELLTQKNQCVFDPCLQHGDTLKAALFAERQFVGIGQTWEECKQAIDCLEPQQRFGQYKLLTQQNSHVLDQINHESVDLLLSEIPLFDFKSDAFNYQSQLSKLNEVLPRYAEKLKPQAYMALIVADQRYQGQYYCRHADIVQLFDKKVFLLQGLINVIQDSQFLKSYGYPNTYVPNIINQFVIIARLR